MKVTFLHAANVGSASRFSGFLQVTQDVVSNYALEATFREIHQCPSVSREVEESACLNCPSQLDRRVHEENLKLIPAKP